MKRISLLLMILTVIALPVMSQKKLSASEQKAAVQQIEKAVSTMKSMTCDFRQVKTLKMLNDKIVSTGSMYLVQPNKLRWQYLKPYSYTFIINGSTVMMKSTGQKNVIDSRQSKIFKEITQIMINSVTGKCLTSGKDFKVELFRSRNGLTANLAPQKKEMKSIFKLIKLHVNPNKHIITQVELHEKSGDVTVINLNNIKTNVSINEKMFATN